MKALGKGPTLLSHRGKSPCSQRCLHSPHGHQWGSPQEAGAVQQDYYTPQKTNQITEHIQWARPTTRFKEIKHHRTLSDSVHIQFKNSTAVDEGTVAFWNVWVCLLLSWVHGSYDHRSHHSLRYL